MIRYVFVIGLALYGVGVSAHQFLPTYPKFDQSFISGIMYTKMELFNKRQDVNYYEIGVYDKDWYPIPFASESKLVQVNYLQTKSINVYIKKEDLLRTTYICTESKIKKEDGRTTAITSQICSKVK